MSEREQVSGGFKSQTFIDVWVKYMKLGNGERASIRRARNMQELRTIPCVPSILPEDAFRNGAVKDGWLRYVYLLPFVTHKHLAYGNINAIGASMGKAGINRGRIRRSISGHSPVDIDNMRRIMRHLESMEKNTFDVKHLGALLYIWDDAVKMRLAEGYYIAVAKTKENKE